MGGTGGRCPAIGISITSAFTAALPALAANLALEIASVRVNLIAAGFVDMSLSAELLGDQLEKRRNQLRKPSHRTRGRTGGRETEQHHGEYEPSAPKHHWSGWYAAYIVARQDRKTPEEAAKLGKPHIEGVK